MNSKARREKHPPDCAGCHIGYKMRRMKYCWWCARKMLRKMEQEGYLTPRPKTAWKDRDTSRDRRLAVNYGVDWWQEEGWRQAMSRATGQAKNWATARKAAGGGLSPRKRAILELLMHEDLRPGEIATRLGTSGGAASVHLSWLSAAGAVERVPRWQGLRYRITPEGRTMFREGRKP